MSNKLPETGGSEEVDLGQLFKLIGNAFERLFKFLGGILNKLFLAFVWTVFFLKKHFLKIVIAGIIGFGLAFIQEKMSGSTYLSSVTVNQNYDTGDNLYDLINYYNSILDSEDPSVLSKELGVEIPENTSFISFEVEPVVDENGRIRNYDSYIKQLDSTLAVDIDYETFLNNTMEHDYKQQKISIKTKESRNLLPVFEGIVNKVKSSEFLKSDKKEI